jgi:hypothetical protein
MRQVYLAPRGVVETGRFRAGHVAFIECPIGIQDDFCPTDPETNESLSAYDDDRKTDQHSCQDDTFHTVSFSCIF